MLYERDKKVRDEVHAFMVEAHQGQKRACGLPYYYHPWWTAKIVEKYAEKHFRAIDKIILPPDQVKINDLYLAGLLHDTIEDCGITYEGVAIAANIQVADLVSQVSADHRLRKPKRKVEYANRLGHATLEGKLLKLADLVHNLQTAYELINEKPTIAEEYLQTWPAEAVMYADSIHGLNNTANAHEWRWARDAAIVLERIMADWPAREKIAANEWPGTAHVLRQFRRKRKRKRSKKTV
jgi:(p)ppGpp synthase/HD superfamily hydrolase